MATTTTSKVAPVGMSDLIFVFLARAHTFETHCDSWCPMIMLIGLLQSNDSAWYGMWPFLPPFARLFLILFFLLAVYTAYVASTVLVRLRSLRTVQNYDSFRKCLTVLSHRAANLRQTIAGMSYLFGLTFFLLIQTAFGTPDNNRRVGLMVLENFKFDFRFAADVFLVFLTLHAVQWFVSSRICKAAFRVGAKVMG